MSTVGTIAKLATGVDWQNLLAVPALPTPRTMCSRV